MNTAGYVLPTKIKDEKWAQTGREQSHMGPESRRAARGLCLWRDIIHYFLAVCIQHRVTIQDYLGPMRSIFREGGPCEVMSTPTQGELGALHLHLLSSPRMTEQRT